jgi:hypothetical protein
MVLTQLTGGLLQLGISKEAGGWGKAIEKGYKAFKGLGSKGKKPPIGAGGKVFKVPLGGSGAPSTASTSGLSSAVQSAPKVNPYASPGKIPPSLMHLKPPMTSTTRWPGGGGNVTRRYSAREVTSPETQLGMKQYLQKARAAPVGSKDRTLNKWVGEINNRTKRLHGFRGHPAPARLMNAHRAGERTLSDRRLADIVEYAGGTGVKVPKRMSRAAVPDGWQGNQAYRQFQSQRDLGRTFRQYQQGSQPLSKLTPAMKEYLKANKVNLAKRTAVAGGGVAAGLLANHEFAAQQAAEQRRQQQRARINRKTRELGGQPRVSTSPGQGQGFNLREAIEAGERQFKKFK